MTWTLRTRSLAHRIWIIRYVSHQQDVTKFAVRFPIFLQGVNTYFAILGNIRMKNGSDEETLWRSRREVVTKHKPNLEEAPFIRRLCYSTD